MTTLYQELADAGYTIRHHESDLYVRVDVISRACVNRAIGRGETKHSCVSLFYDTIDGTLNYDIAFAYDPFWDARFPH